MKKNNVVFIDGCRTPFLRSGTNYLNLMSYQLGQFAIKGLLLKTGINPKKIDQVIMGTVISNSKTSNVARESTSWLLTSLLTRWATAHRYPVGQRLVDAGNLHDIIHTEAAIPAAQCRQLAPPPPRRFHARARPS